MKKTLLLLSCLLLLARVSNAQITLTQDGYPTEIRGTDTFKTTTYNSAFPSLSAATNAFWDMSIVTDSTPLFYTIHQADVMREYTDSNDYVRGGFGYSGNAEYSVVFAGLQEYSVIVKKDSFSLSLITGGLIDSFIINDQAMNYSSPRKQIAFPATYNTKWRSEYYSDLNFTLTVFALSYDHAPGYIRRYVVEADTVIGWGRMVVKNISGAASDTFKVLQVKTVTETIDSFFLNGALFSALLLSQLDLSQGVTDTSYVQNYYQAAQVSPLAQVTFSDATYNTPVRAKTRVNHFSEVNAVKDIHLSNVSVFPNPVNGNKLNIDLPAPRSGKWGYALVSADGKTVARGTATAPFTLDIPDMLANGIYDLELTDGAYAKRTIPVNIVR